MNRLTELKQKSPSFGLRNRRSNETKTRSRRVILLLLLLSTLFWAAGCEDYYSSPGYYDPRVILARMPARSVCPVAVSWQSRASANPADFLDHDRRYYRGPGFSDGGVYYVWDTRLLGISHRCLPRQGPRFRRQQRRAT